MGHRSVPVAAVQLAFCHQKHVVNRQLDETVQVNKRFRIHATQLVTDPNAGGARNFAVRWSPQKSRPPLSAIYLVQYKRNSSEQRLSSSSCLLLTLTSINARCLVAPEAFVALIQTGTLTEDWSARLLFLSVLVSVRSSACINKGHVPFTTEKHDCGQAPKGLLRLSIQDRIQASVQ